MQINRWLIFLFLLLGFGTYGQNPATKIPLENYIKQVETKFDVKFSYAVADVAEVKLFPPQTKQTLQEVIEYLNTHTVLNFKSLDNRYITVTKANKRITICGTLYTSDTKMVLAGASIAINGIVKTTTNNQGFFTIENTNPEAIVLITYLGYENQQILASDFLNSDSCKKIVLKPMQQELNPVLINVYLTAGLQKYIDGSIVLNTKKFEILPGLVQPDVLQSIQVLPGVESTNESIANINVRGGTNDQNAMFWDNIKMYHSGHFFGLISAYNPNLTNQVVVTKNGTSAAYSDGVSSTISMFTKDDVSSKFSGGIGVNLIDTDAFIEIPLAKKWSIHLSGRRSFTDFLDTPTFTNYFERSFQDSEIKAKPNPQDYTTKSDFYFYDYTAKLLFDLNENHQLRANIIGIQNDLAYTENNFQQNQVDTKSSSLGQKNLGAGLNWKGKWNEKWETEFNTYYSKYTINATDYRLQTDQLLTETNEVLETGTKLNATYKAFERLEFLTGYQVTETGMLNQTTVSAPTYSSTKKNVLLSQALFSEMELHYPKTFLRMGVRVNYFDKFNKFIVEPRLNFRQVLATSWALKMEGEFKNQIATQIIDFEDDFLGVEKRRWVVVNNSSIPIATSKQASIGIEFKKNNLTIDATSFYKIVNGITASNQGFYNNFQYKNANGSYTVKGAEFLINKTAQSYSVWTSYTWSKNDYTFESFTPSQFPNNVDIRHSVTFGFNYNLLKNLSLSVGGIWHSGHPYTSPVLGNETTQTGNTIVVNYDTPNTKNLDDFKRLDMSVSYKFPFSSTIKGILRAGIINMTDEKNSISRYYKVNPSNTNQAIEVNNTSLGLTPNLSFRVNF
ncbi:TonB-dependent receptor plug domain-containing protein [Flavobacterium sp. UMI-01]|uniref:TonB-dependent receptor n=1 Tax=Flavobacterium sp. UMI-01 TaxID=1441053 RepID=UPI001C7CDA46|nr:TonB-dependent receptor plug domain-containing protein [Flavobacterium sp. UMI-01]GIZ08532.1 TonB-dependent receptor [Flavobacterium sp. UMI-01]